MTLGGIAQRLISEGILTTAAARDLTAAAHKAKLSFLQYCVAYKKLDARLLALAAARELNLPFLDLDTFNREQQPRNLLSEQLIRHHMALPLYRKGSTLFLAMAFADSTAIDDIQFFTGMTAEVVLTPYDQLHQAIETYLEGGAAALAHLEQEEIDTTDQVSDSQDQLTLDTQRTDDAPIVRFVNRMLLDAVRKGASDIHLEPYEHSFRIRYRNDGLLHEVMHPPFSLRHRIIGRIKVMAHLDISERRLPQDGRIKLKIAHDQTLDLRVNTLPTLWGEKIVLRLLDTHARMEISELGFSPSQQLIYEKALSSPQGMILVTGPTGSGKTMTLYAGLHMLNTSERNIATAEDPVEINLTGVNQVNINPRVGFDFAAALRAFLRQDPDVVMIGEIRDSETAEIAIKAAQTGHLVLSTLHTNSASETLLRLSNLGVNSFNIATSISLIIAQRLARKLCNHCKKPVDLPNHRLLQEGFATDELHALSLYEAGGCRHCYRGYKGRIAIYEMLSITPRLKELMMTSAHPHEITLQAKTEGFKTLRDSALEKVRQGLTSLTEIKRVTTA